MSCDLTGKGSKGPAANTKAAKENGRKLCNRGSSPPTGDPCVCRTLATQTTTPSPSKATSVLPGMGCRESRTFLCSRISVCKLKPYRRPGRQWQVQEQELAGQSVKMLHPRASAGGNFLVLRGRVVRWGTYERGMCLARVANRRTQNPANLRTAACNRLLQAVVVTRGG